MKLQRTKNTTRNFIWGSIYQVSNIILPFFSRTIFIYILGEQYLGLNSLFGSILSVLNMSELGFASAIVYNMYGAIARDDEKEICALMNFYKRCYRIIGLVIFFVGSFVFPFLPRLISGDIPSDINIYILYGISLFSTGISYFLYAYKHSIFWAFQRDDLDKKIMIPLDIVKYCVQIVSLIVFRNYYLYVIIIPLFSMIINISRGILVDKYYPQYKASGNISKESLNSIKKNVKALFINKVGGTLTVSFDTIVISSFLGLGILAKYNNYYYIMTSVIGFIQILFDSLLAGWGNSLKTETLEKNRKLFREITFVNNWIICWCSSCFFSLYQPFISLWIGDEFLLPNSVVALIVVYFLVWRYQYVLTTCKDAAGLWHSDRFRPLVVGVVNLFLNVLLVKKIGLSGVLLSSIITWLVIGFPWLVNNVFKSLLKLSAFKYILDTIVFYVTTIIIMFLNFYMCSLFKNNGLLGFIFRIIICIVVPNLIFVVINWHKEEFKSFVIRIKYLRKRE